MTRRPILISMALFMALAAPTIAADRETKTKNLIFVMLDGVRWQEVFSGAEETLINKDRGGVANVPALKQRFWRDTPEARREILFPFLWGVVAKEGQLIGNIRKKSVARVTNGKHFSYPGYNEVLCGFPDPKVDSNDKIYNRNVTFLEWLNQKPAFKGKVAAFTSWEVFPFIINDRRSGIPVYAGFAPLEGLGDSPEIALLNRLQEELPLEGETTRHDALTFHAARHYLKTKKPRVMYVSFDETDTQGHAGRYDRVLGSAHKNDRFVRDLWELAQSLPEYKGTTSLVITTDHGRGDPPDGWKSHSTKIPGSEYIWAGFLGPDTPASGEIVNQSTPVTQSQIAATAAGMLGLDYNAAVPQAAPPIGGVVAGK